VEEARKNMESASMSEIKKMEANTIPALFWSRTIEWADRVAMCHKDFGIWKSITWKEYGENAKYVCLGLISLGMNPGDRATIMSENNPEWLFSDMGILAGGGISVGIYTTDSEQQVAYILNNCDSRFHFVEDEEQLDKVLEVREKVPTLEKIIIFDMEGLRHFQDPMVISFEALLGIGRELELQEPVLFDQRRNEPRPDETAILIYTSGTTGPPKGAMMSHRNILDTNKIQNEANPCSEKDEILSFLPLCHIAERNLSVFNALLVGYVVNFAEGPDTVPENIREVAPSVFFAVPRIWEKFYSSLVLAMKDSTRFEKKAFDWGIRIGKKRAALKLSGNPVPGYLQILYALVDLTVLRNLKKSIGLNKARQLTSGAAPISPDLLHFYYALGLPMREVYGQTECCGPGTIHHGDDVKVGTVGKPLPRCEVKIAETGEILFRGPNVFLGYWKDPERTKETIDAEGWLHTGDVGRIDEDGHLIVTDRLKDIIITAGGKNVTPTEIENQLKFSPYINDAVVIGDGRKYLTALIMIDEETVMKYAQEKRVPFTTYDSLTKAAEIMNLLEQEVNKSNEKFSRVEQIKRFHLINIQLSADDDEVTPTMKLKRKYVMKKFSKEIEAMYGR
jgi:long-chain acyl-CoA synthetase